MIIYVADPDIEEEDHPPQFHGNLWTSDAQRLVDAVRPLIPSENDRVEPGSVELNSNAIDYAIVCERVQDYLKRKEFQRVSFAAIREYVDPGYSDEILFELVRRHHKIFRLTRLSGGKQGLAQL